jgi:hypothetical protein
MGEEVPLIEPATELETIELALDAGSYEPGPWLPLVREIARRPPQERARLAADVDRVSDKLHARRSPRRFQFERAFALEHLAGLLGLLGMEVGAQLGSALVVVLGTLVLVTALQPIVKVGTGLALGLRYSYAYLLYGEPRFKLRYGRYLAAAPWRRIAYHAAGMLGCPSAWWIAAALSAQATPRTSQVLALMGVAHLAYQLLVLLLALSGRRRMWPYGALRLTSPGALGQEIRQTREGAPATGE